MQMVFKFDPNVAPPYPWHGDLDLNELESSLPEEGHDVLVITILIFI